MIRILEYLWLLICISGIITAVHAFNKHGFGKDSISFIIISIFSFFMYLVKKNKRISSQKK